MKNILLSTACLLLSIAANAQYNIALFAGTGTATPGDGLPATSVSVYTAAICLTPAGDVIFRSSDRVRKVAIASGIITTIAGGGTNTGENIPATDAALPSTITWGGICTDHSGNIYYFSDAVIRKIDISTGLVKTIAGNGTVGFAGDGGPATAAELSPGYMAADGDGNVYFSSTSVIRRIDAVSGIITLYAGGGTTGMGDGGAATAAQLYGPRGIAFDASGNLYIASWSAIRKIDKVTGIITTVAGLGTATGDGIAALTAKVGNTWGITLDNSGNIYFSEGTSLIFFKIRKITAASGLINDIAGDGTATISTTPIPARDAVLARANALVVNPAGSMIYVTSLTTVSRVYMPGAGVGDIEETKAANIFPNPSRGTFNLVTSIMGRYNVVVTNVLGQCVYACTEYRQKAEITIPDPVQGVYFVTVSQGERKQTMRTTIIE